MKFKEYFTGISEEKAAKQKLEELNREKEEKGGKLGRRKQEDLDGAYKMSRRRFNRIFWPSVGLLAAGGTIAYLSLKEDEQPVQEVKPSFDSQKRIEPVDSMKSAEFMKMYDEGFAMLMAKVPDEPTQVTDPSLKQLSILKKFKRNMVRWAEIDAAGDINALEQGVDGGGWMVISPVKSDFLMHVDSRPNINLLHIKPVNISKLWAGIFLSHEIDHLYARISGIEPKLPSSEEWLEGEMAAYYYEKSGVDVYTDGQFSLALEQALQEFKIKSIDELLLVVSDYDSGKDKSKLREITEFLNPIISNEAPKSEDELANRMGFYIHALAFPLIDRQYNDIDSRRAAMKNFVRSNMNISGFGHYLKD